jgi:starch phosphorylase
MTPSPPGLADLVRAADLLATRLPAPLAPLARIAYDYAWAWTPGGATLFSDLDARRFRLAEENPVRFLRELEPDTLAAAARDRALVARIAAVDDALRRRRARPRPGPLVAYFSAEFGLHHSLPIYSGGLGVLAGDMLKEAADGDVAMVGVGLYYRRGYFRQRLELSGWQQEYWIDLEPAELPAARVTDAAGAPVSVVVPVLDRSVRLDVWCVAASGVPLYLLDAERDDNGPVERWITGRLYESSRVLRLCQYAALGVGGVRALRALGLDPAVVHLNEGHAVLAALELVAEGVAAGEDFDAACAAARRRVVFTTHTPVPAGNERISGGELSGVLGDLPGRLGVSVERLMALGADPGTPGVLSLTALALRLSRHANGVSVQHAHVARHMWHGLYPDRREDEVPIAAITNGVHLPTWMSRPMQALFDRHLAAGWRERAADPAVWAAVDDISDAELWAARCAARRELVEAVRALSQTDRLRRGEPLEYVEAAARALDPEVLTTGFARRLATYKRLHLIIRDPARALALLRGATPLQFLFAGKAHPQDEPGKRTLQHIFSLKNAPDVASRVTFLEDYDIDLAQLLVAGCDVWVNLPRPPFEASGTSGMKAVLCGGLHLSVLDGWWAEAFAGENGWAIAAAPLGDAEREDDRDAGALYDLLEREVVPEFYDRDAAGVPRRWMRRIRASLRTLGPRYNASRMLADYRERAYLTR